jgi:hypothetical protein
MMADSEYASRREGFDQPRDQGVPDETTPVEQGIDTGKEMSWHASIARQAVTLGIVRG